VPKDEKQVSNIRRALKIMKQMSEVLSDPADNLFLIMQQVR